MDTPPHSRILITGSSGFVGGYLIAGCQMVYPRAEIVGLSLHAAGHAPGADHQPITFLETDLADAAQVRRAIAQARPDLIFHLAAQASVAASWADPAATLAINAGGALNLLEALRAERLAPRIILIGSGEQYGMVAPDENPIRETCLPRPANPYAVSKAVQDLYGYQYFIAYGLPIIRVRAFNHFGPRQPATLVIASFARQIALIEAGRAEPVLAVGNLQARRDFLPVEDVVRAYLMLAERGHAGEAYNVGSGQARAISEVLEALLERARVPITVRTDPERLRPVDVPLLVADTSRLRADTGWEPTTSFEQALSQILDYWRAAIAAE